MEMTFRLVDGDVVAVFDADAVRKLEIEPGMRMALIETEEGFVLRPLDDDERMARARRIMDRYSEALAELAK